MPAVPRTAIGVIALAAVVAGLTGSAHAASTETYVVVLNADVADVRGAASGLARAHGGSTGYVYEHALRGFSIRVSAQGAAGIARNPRVAYVEADREFAVSAQSMPTGVARIFAPANANLDIDGTDDERVDVDVAVLDTGIDLDHPDLNVAGSTNCASFFATCGAGGDDGNGHGTHVAGTIGALDNGSGVVGVAPGARLWAVRVLGNNGTGTTSQIIAGMDWVTARASTIEVANMSLTGAASASIDSAASRMADAGIAVVVAAGNNDGDASAYSPARAAKVLTVSAMADYDGLAGGLSQPPSSFCLDQDDTLADFSNWGSTIDIAAPGCRILSTYLTGGYAWINGTSMASPHAAGALALLASAGFPRSWTGVSALYDTLKAEGNLDWTDESGDGVKEPLLDVSDSAVFDPRVVGESPPPNQAPIAKFTFTCINLACSFSAAGSSDADGSIVSYAWAFGDGATGAGVSASRTYASGGTYTVTLTVQDDDGATNSTATSVVATPPVVQITVALTGSSVNSGSRWTASVLIAVTANSAPAQGQLVSGTWSNGASGTSSCTTAAGTGRCTVSKSGLRKTIGSVRFTVNTVAGSSTFGGTSSVTVPKP
jgi:subtilisin family serine protease